MGRKNAVHIFYGVKLISIWLLAACLAVFGFMLVREFKAKVTVEKATLLEEQWDMYQGERASFNASINGRNVQIITPPDCREGDTVDVIMRDGSVFKTVWEEADITTYATVPGRILHTLNSCVGKIPFILIAVFAAAALLVGKQSRLVRDVHPVLSVITHILGGAAAVLSLFLWMRGVDDNTWDGFGMQIFAYLIPAAYAVLLLVVWIVRSVSYNLKNA